MESEIFEELPHQLRAVVAQHQTAQLLAGIRVFSSLSPEERKIVASKLVPITLGVGQDVCSQGDFADRMWILQEGDAPSRDRTILPLHFPTMNAPRDGVVLITICLVARRHNGGHLWRQGGRG